MGKILNEKYRIATTDMPGEPNRFKIYYGKEDIIILNSDMPGQQEIVKLMVEYLEHEDKTRKAVFEFVTDDTLKGILYALAQIVRIRRKLNRFKCA